ncbi:FAD/NAD(P)-binding domain-containing protein [Chloropicon primus]|nr:FAD/NAD(P)-binding domain-containing protein [Chloropicon primus]
MSFRRGLKRGLSGGAVKRSLDPRLQQRPRATASSAGCGAGAAEVIIAGGGPAGLFSSFLLARAGIKSTVLEKAERTEDYSSRSYTIVLNERGKGALLSGSPLFSKLLEAGSERRFVYMIDGRTGSESKIPKNPPGVGFTRPQLVRLLEAEVEGEPLVKLSRGSGVTAVTESADTGFLRVHLDDGSELKATHVIGCDGKWSKVRQSLPSFRGAAEITSVPSFGVHATTDAPKGWSRDGTHVIKGSSDLFYVIASLLPGDRRSLTIVCKEKIAQTHPWLRPAEVDGPAAENWEGDCAEPEFKLLERLEGLLRDELPAFDIGAGLRGGHINRRASWLRWKGEEVTFSSEGGRVALIGDAAHAMTASVGEGCNCALESAARLAEAVVAEMKAEASETCSASAMSKAFVSYGLARPGEVVPVQEMSATRNGWKKEI